jgi:hypothetical protein
MTRMQSEDRNHRDGQIYPVSYYDLICSPAERAVVYALQNKFSVVDGLRLARARGELDAVLQTP